VALLTAAMAEAASGWVLSGSIGAWGDPLLRRFDLVVFVETPTTVRLARLRARATATFGAEHIAPGGEHHAVFVEFLEWAAGYDDGIFTGRSRARHEAWLAAVPCPVLRVAGTDPPAELAVAVESAWRERGVLAGAPTRRCWRRPLRLLSAPAAVLAAHLGPLAAQFVARASPRALDRAKIARPRAPPQLNPHPLIWTVKPQR